MRLNLSAILPPKIGIQLVKWTSCHLSHIEMYEKEFVEFIFYKIGITRISKILICVIFRINNKLLFR